MKESGDLTNKHVIIKLSALSAIYQTPENQLFFVDGGFGVTEGSLSLRGGKCFGIHTLDNERGYVYRNDIDRLATPEEITAGNKLCQ